MNDEPALPKPIETPVTPVTQTITNKSNHIGKIVWPLFIVSILTCVFGVNSPILLVLGFILFVISFFMFLHLINKGRSHNAKVGLGIATLLVVLVIYSLMSIYGGIWDVFGFLITIIQVVLGLAFFKLLYLSIRHRNHRAMLGLVAIILIVLILVITIP